MKNLISKLALLFFTALLISSCHTNFSGIKGSGNVTTQNRPITGDFTNVEVGNGMEVVIEQSDSKAIIVEADDNVQSHILTEILNGTLKISSDQNGFMNATMKVTVKLPVVSGIMVGRGSELSANKMIRSEELNIKSESGSSIEINVEADKLISESSGGSEIVIKGKALTYDSSASSGSSTDAENLMSNEVTAQASSGSSITVHAILKLEAKASSGSEVDYVGKPKTITKQENSGGSVSNK